MPARIADRQGGYAAMPAMATIGAATMAETASVTAAQVRDLLRARRLRADFLPGDLFADPAWDMMLDLLAARYGMAEHLAYAYLSAATDFDISQVVDIVCGVHARIREADFADVARAGDA